MSDRSIFSVISPIMAGPSSSHTAGAVRLGLMARNIYGRDFKRVDFTLYNSFATTGYGHGTDKGLLAGVLGYGVDYTGIKHINQNVKNIEYSYNYLQDISRHPNSVDILFDNKMKISGDSIGAGEIRICNINGFTANIDGKYDTLMLMYKDKPGIISMVCSFIQKQSINIATLHCDRDTKGGTATMYIALDAPIDKELIDEVISINDIFFVTNIRKL